MAFNLGAALNDVVEGVEIGSDVITTLEVDKAVIDAGQPATITLPPVAGSIDGHVGHFSGSITFTQATPPPAG